jgi:hypothetical protein
MKIEKTLLTILENAVEAAMDGYEISDADTSTVIAVAIASTAAAFGDKLIERLDKQNEILANLDAAWGKKKT